MTDALELDTLWAEFHRVVNMTSQELAAWLRVQDAGERSEPLPGQAGPETGQHVLALLQKRRTELTDADIDVMYEVVDTVTAEQDRTGGPGPEHADGDGDTARRHRLMSLGHDPLKPDRADARASIF